MKALYSFTRKSGNGKTGPIPVARAPKSSCPSSCPLRGKGCYAELGRVGMAWKRQEERGVSLTALLAEVRSLPAGQLWRYGEAGDLPGSGERINRRDLERLVSANQGRRGFAYTHKKRDLEPIRWANARGFTINLSADSMAEADSMIGRGVPVVVTVPSTERRPSYLSPNGNQVTTCPAVLQPDITCDDCQLCQKQHETIVAFPAHSQRTRIIDERLALLGN